MNIYSIYDSKAKAYLQPFFSPNNATAIRSFTQAANEKGGSFNLHSGDYSLFQIGEWDEHTGKLTPSTHADLGTATQYIQAQD